MAYSVSEVMFPMQLQLWGCFFTVFIFNTLLPVLSKILYTSIVKFPASTS
jgi:hypothetical protein